MNIPINPHLPSPTGVSRATGGQPPVSFQPPSQPQPQQREVFTSSGAPPEGKIATRSGLKGMVRQDQMGVAMQATLPAGGGLLPVAVLLQSTPTGAWTAHIGEEFKDQKPTQMGSDGRVYVELEKGSPAVVFDPRSLDYGLSGGSVQTPTGWQRTQMELIDQHGTRHYIFNESASSTAHGVKNEFTEVKYDGRGMTGARVVRTTGGPPPAGNDFGLGGLMGGPENSQVPMGVRMNQDNSMTLEAPRLSQMANKGGLNMLMGKLTGKSENVAGTFMPFSAMHPGSLFPALLGGQPIDRPQVQVPPPLPPPPAAAPSMMEQFGFGGGQQEEGGFMDQLGLGNIFGGGQREQTPQAPPRPVGPPVTFGAPQQAQGPGAPVSFGAGPGAPSAAPVSFGQPPGPGAAPVSFGQPPSAAPAAAPVSFGQPPSAGPAADPQQALRARYPQVDDTKFQAAWTLSGGNPEKAEQLLQQFGA